MESFASSGTGPDPFFALELTKRHIVDRVNTLFNV